jgi:membrane protease YdiL (CAAX protease family)
MMSRELRWYTVLVLALSWTLTLSAGMLGLGRSPMTAAMGLPMLLALAFVLISKKERLSSIGWKAPGVLYFLLSVLLPILQVGVVVGIGRSAGLLSLNREHFAFHEPTSHVWLNLLVFLPAMFVPFILLPLPNFILGWFSHLGEEFAWRGYLFRRMARENNKLVRAVLVSGAVWWAWHLPMFWLSPVLSALTLPQLGLTVLLSAPAILGTAFMYSWVYMKSGSIWAPTIMHLFWNLYRGTLTGRLADGAAGLFAGDLWLVNGEGVIGMIVTACFGLLFYALMIREQQARITVLDKDPPGVAPAGSS